MQPNVPSFERLEQAVTLIARHPECPGKLEVVAECVKDIEDGWERGRLTLQQRFRLLAILVQGTAARRDAPLMMSA